MFNVDEIRNLSDDVVDDGMWMEFRHPITGEKTGAEWLIASRESNAFKAAAKINMKKITKRARKLGIPVEEVEELPAEVERLMVSLILDWRNMRDRNGKEVPFSSKNAADLVGSRLVRDNIVDQISVFSSDNEAFFKASQKSLPMPSDTK